MLYSGLALALIVLILFVSFHWRANSWLVLANLPFSLDRQRRWRSAVTGIGISLGTVVGSCHGVRHQCPQRDLAARALRAPGGGRGSALGRSNWSLRGANERLVPILMTAAVTALGLAPLAFGMNLPGQEIEGPMAVTVLGGLLSSTCLNLFVLPALAQRYVRM